MTAFWQLFIQFAAAATAIGVLFGMRRLGQAPDRILMAAWPLAFAIGAYGFIISVPQSIFADFIMGYHRGGGAVLHGREALGAVLGPDVHGFVNLPIMAYLFSPFSLLPPMVAGYLWLALGIVSLVVVWRMLSHLAQLDTFGRALLLVLIGASGPTLYCLKEGNSGHMALVALLGALFLIRKDKPFVAGLLLGAMAATKLPLLLFGVYYALRGRWAVVAGGGAILAAIGAASVLVFGWDFQVRWYEACIAPYSTNPLPAFNVQSVASFFARLETGASGIEDWRPFTLSPLLALAAKGVVAALVGGALIIGVLARRRDGALQTGSWEETIEFTLVLTLACVASPLAWAHYFVWLLPALALFLPGSPFAPQDFLRTAALWKAIVLMVLVPLPVAAWGLARKVYVLSASDYLYAALALLFLLIWARWRPDTFSAEAALPPAETGTLRAAPATV